MNKIEGARRKEIQEYITGKELTPARYPLKLIQECLYAYAFSRPIRK